jgi:hypothetical protein
VSATVAASPPARLAHMPRAFGDFNRRWAEVTRTPRRQRLIKHLVECGERPVMECLLAIADGADLDETLEDFARLKPETVAAIGADVLPIDELVIRKGGKQ